MFAATCRVVPTAALVSSAILLFTTPNPVFAFFEDCVMNPGETCCHCAPIMGFFLCTEGSSDGQEYCSSQVCPEDDPCSV